MELHIIARRERLPDVRDVAEYRTQSALLAELQLLADIVEGGGAGSLPFDAASKVLTQSSGDAYPVGLAQRLVGLPVLDGAIYRGADA